MKSGARVRCHRLVGFTGPYLQCLCSLDPRRPNCRAVQQRFCARRPRGSLLRKDSRGQGSLSCRKTFISQVTTPLLEGPEMPHLLKPKPGCHCPIQQLTNKRPSPRCKAISSFRLMRAWDLVLRISQASVSRRRVHGSSRINIWDRVFGFDPRSHRRSDSDFACC
jgi:hypothetical protein